MSDPNDSSKKKVQKHTAAGRCLAVWSRWVSEVEAAVELLKTDFPVLLN